MKILPEWITIKWRENSMGAADKKGEWAFCIGGSVVLLAVFLAFTIVRGDGVGGFSKLMSWITFFACVYAVWKSPDMVEGRSFYWICTLVGVALMIGFAIGFK